jgi:Ca2+/Na+ antiporter
MLVSTNEADDIKDSSEGTEMSGVELSSVSRSPKSVRSRSQGHGYGAVPEAAQRLATSTHSPGHDGLGLGLAGDLDGLDDFENIGKLLIEEDEEMPAVTKPIVDHSGPVSGRSTKVEAGNSIFDEEDDRIGAAQDDSAEAEEVNCQLPCPVLERIRLFAMTAIETVISFGMPTLRPISSSSPSTTAVSSAITDPEAPVEAASTDDGDDDQEELVPLSRAFFSLFVCIVYVGILASVVVNLCSTLVDELGVGGSTLGATVVALGAEVLIIINTNHRTIQLLMKYSIAEHTVCVSCVRTRQCCFTLLLQIPDTISAIALAKKGYNNAAMSGAIGSQVHTHK